MFYQLCFSHMEYYFNILILHEQMEPKLNIAALAAESILHATCIYRA